MINSEYIILDGLDIHTWKTPMEYFSDIIVDCTFEAPDDGLLYTMVIDKPRVEGLNKHINDLAWGDSVLRGCHWSDKPDFIYYAFPVTWFKRVLNELELKTDDEEMRDKLWLNVAAVESLEKQWRKNEPKLLE